MITQTNALWNTFTATKDHLFNQFRDIPFVPSSGLPFQDLEEKTKIYLKQNSQHPRVVQKANVFRIIATEGQIAVDPLDWFADKLNHGNILRKLGDRWLNEAIEGPLTAEESWLKTVRETGLAKIPKGGLDRGHIAPGWEHMLSVGLNGLISDINEARSGFNGNLSDENKAFYDALEIVYGATLTLSRRFAEMADRMAAEHPAQIERLTAVATACRQVPGGKPRTFHEALQFTWIMHELIEMEGEYVRSMGHFDRTLYPYYAADIEAGRLTRDQAKELLKFYWIKWYSRTRGVHNGKNFVFGGQYRDGSAVENELTYLALEAYEELEAPDPKLSVRFLPDTGDRLYRRVSELIRKGLNSFVLMNDTPAVQALVNRGKPIEDARYFLPIGCYEPAVEGKEVACTMNITVNLAKFVELALADGKDPKTGRQMGPKTGDPLTFNTFEDVFAAYTSQLKWFLAEAAQCIAAAEREWPFINPSPLIAGTIDNCIEVGRDVGQGGPQYNSVGFVGAALANAADSLLAIKQAIYLENRFSMSELLNALGQNFEGHEPMRKYLISQIPKWGNGQNDADSLGKRIADLYSDTVHSFTNQRGGSCQAALFTLEYAWYGGKLTGALPDGRRSGESLAPGTGATYGRDIHGVTSLLSSVSKLDAKQLPNGSVLDVTLHPSIVSGERGLDTMVHLIKTYFESGGYALQFNIYDVDMLREAQKHPERFENLQIRLTGWSVHFTTLSKEVQDQFIDRIAHAS